MNLIDKFVNQYENGTRQTYKYNLQHYFKAIKTDPDKYFTSKRNYEKDIEQFWKYEKEYTKAVCTRNTRLNAVRQFLIENDVELSQKFWKKLKRSTKDKGNRPVTIDSTPTRYELRRIILEGKPISRAMFLIASSSGMRIGEILSLVKEDVDLEHNPPKINVRAEYTKNGQARVVFISSEAKESLEKWYSLREDWKKKAVLKLKGLATYDYSKDNRIFPIHRVTTSIFWMKMLERANLNKRDPTTKIHTLHIHTLRKYFRTNMAKPLGIDVTEALLGHSGYLTDAYRRYSIKQLGELYKEAEKSVLVFEEEAPDLSGVHEELTGLRDENKVLKDDLIDVKLQLLELRADLYEKKQKR